MMRNVSSSIALAILLGASSMASPSFAQPAPKSDVQTDRARELHKQADELFSKRQFDKARAAYLAAWALKTHWQIAASLGDTELRLGLHRDAAEHLTAMIAMYPPDEDKKTLSDAKAMLEKAKAKIGTVTLASNVEGADVSVNGTVIGKTPLRDPIYLDPGSHNIEVKKVGFVSKSQAVVAAAGKAERLDVQLEAENTGSGTPAPDPKNVGAKDPKKQNGGQTPDPDPVPPPDSGKSVPLLVTGGILAGAGVVVGATLLGLGASRASERDDMVASLGGPSPCGEGTPHSSACAEITSLDDDYVAFSIGGGVALGVGAALGIATLIYGVVPSGTSDDQARTFILPVVTKDTAGIVVGGEF
jgi:hypothetical protein